MSLAALAELAKMRAERDKEIGNAGASKAITGTVQVGEDASTSEAVRDVDSETGGGGVEVSAAVDRVVPIAVGALSNADQVVARISELQAALTAQLPGYEKLLQQIHTQLMKDDEIVHLLTDEQIGTIVSGLARKKDVVIASVDTKAGKSGGGKKRQITVDDL